MQSRSLSFYFVMVLFLLVGTRGEIIAQDTIPYESHSWEQQLYPKRSKRYNRAVWVLRKFVKGKEGDEKLLDPNKRTEYFPKSNKFRGMWVEDLTLNGVRVAHLIPKNTSPERVLLYFHGGAYIDGPWKLQWNMAVEMADQTNAELYIPYYRLSPENKFPAEQEDALAVYKALIDKHDPKKIIPFGDSAGGGLTMSLFELIRDNQLPMPACQVLISPWLHIASENPELYETAKIDPLLSSDLNHTTPKMLTDPEEFQNPLFSPYFADLDQLPPTLIMIGTWDLLWPDTRDFYQRAVQEGRPVEMVIGKEMFHVWPGGVGKYPEADIAVRQMCDWIRFRVE